MRRILPLMLCILSVLILVGACASKYISERDNKDKREYSALTDNAADEPNVFDNSLKSGNNEILSSAPRIDLSLYFYDEANSQLVTEVRNIVRLSRENLIQHAVKELIKGPKSGHLKPVIAKNTKLLDINVAENILTVDLSKEFLESENHQIARAALVNTLLELGDYKYIDLTVEGKELTKEGQNDTIIGLLTRYPTSIHEIMAAEAKLQEGTEVKKLSRELFFQDIQGKYLLPEVRTITVTGNQYVPIIVNELIKGPYAANEGLYAPLPKGTVLIKTEAVKDEKQNMDGVALYFSDEFKTQFKGDAYHEKTMLGSLVYSLTTLPDIDFVKIYYENEAGEFVDNPVLNLPLKQNLTMQQFSGMLGKRIRIYFGDKQGTLLVPEYRAVSMDENNIPSSIINELFTQPSDDDSIGVITSGIRPEDIKVSIVGKVAIVDLPSAFFEGDDSNTAIIQRLYAIVNSLTDPINLCDVAEVQFIVDGKAVDIYDDISLKDGFVMNPALIKVQ